MQFKFKILNCKTIDPYYGVMQVLTCMLWFFYFCSEEWIAAIRSVSDNLKVTEDPGPDSLSPQFPNKPKKKVVSVSPPQCTLRLSLNSIIMKWRHCFWPHTAFLAHRSLLHRVYCSPINGVSTSPERRRKGIELFEAPKKLHLTCVLTMCGSFSK